MTTQDDGFISTSKMAKDLGLQVSSVFAQLSPGSLKPASYGQFKTSQSLFVLIALFSFWTSAMLVAA